MAPPEHYDGYTARPHSVAPDPSATRIAAMVAGDCARCGDYRPARLSALLCLTRGEPLHDRHRPAVHLEEDVPCSHDARRSRSPPLLIGSSAAAIDRQGDLYWSCKSAGIILKQTEEGTNPGVPDAGNRVSATAT